MQPISIGADFGASNTVIAVVGADLGSTVLKVPCRADSAAQENRKLASV